MRHNLPVIETRALGRHVRRRLVAARACDISNMVYKLNHEYIPIMFIGQNEKSLELTKICIYKTIWPERMFNFNVISNSYDTDKVSAQHYNLQKAELYNHWVGDIIR